MIILREKKPTRDDHFVPRGYLKKFALDPQVKSPRIYQFDIDGIAEHKPVPINSICYKDRLYEIKDANGQIIVENGIEKSINVLENRFYSVRNNILKKLFVINHQNCLTEKERAILLQAALLQLLRYEEIPAIFKSILTQLHPETINTPEHIKDIIAKIACLPLFLNYDNVEMTEPMKKFKQWATRPPILYGLMQSFSTHHICLGYNSITPLWICDRPVIVRSDSVHTFDMIIYPITPQLVVYIYSRDIPFPHHDNSLFYMTHDEVNFLQQEIVINAKRWIYSNRELSSQERADIATIRKEINDKLIKLNGVVQLYSPQHKITSTTTSHIKK